MKPISFRILKVDRTSPASTKARRFYPRVRLQGRWLKDAGFETGDLVKVTAKKDIVVVEKVFPAGETN